MENKLFSPIKFGSIQLKNRIAMAPMTRSRATSNNIPAPAMAEYYAQRTDAGLIITEGTSPSPNGLGYPRIPGIFNDEQIAAWKVVTDAVHNKDGHIFVQLMHSGRITHISNLPTGAEVLAPSAVKANGQLFSDTEGMVDFSAAREMTTAEVKSTINEFVKASKNAITAGFDGVELHAANGYLIEQFINPRTNQRTDEYGGPVEARGRFLLEIVAKVATEIGKDKIGVRFSPYGAFNDMPTYDEVQETYVYLAQKLNELDIQYVHVLDHSSMGAPPVPQAVKDRIRAEFKNKLISTGGFTKETAKAAIEDGSADLIAFGKTFLANPDLVNRMKLGTELNQPDFGTFYTPGEKGYTDYPILQESTI
jgi:N-ethylmaleimide reductase